MADWQFLADSGRFVVSWECPVSAAERSFESVEGPSRGVIAQVRPNRGRKSRHPPIS